MVLKIFLGLIMGGATGYGLYLLSAQIRST